MDPNLTNTATEVFAIHEVHYDAKGQPISYTENPAVVLTSVDDDEAGKNIWIEAQNSLRWQLQKMLEAVDKPALTADDFKPLERSNEVFSPDGKMHRVPPDDTLEIFVKKE